MCLVHSVPLLTPPGHRSAYATKQVHPTQQPAIVVGHQHVCRLLVRSMMHTSFFYLPFKSCAQRLDFALYHKTIPPKGIRGKALQPANPTNRKQTFCQRHPQTKRNTANRLPGVSLGVGPTTGCPQRQQKQNENNINNGNKQAETQQ